MKTYQDKPNPELHIKELTSAERPREKLREKGSLALADTELLTIMIGSGTMKVPAPVLASRVLDFLDQRRPDDEVSVETLMVVDGMGLAKASLICAALELGRRRLPSKRKQIIFPSDAYPLVRHFGTRQQEHFLCISLNGAHEVVAVNVVSIGLVNHTLVHPRDVLS